MKAVRVHRNPDCPTCASHARWHERLDWPGRVETSTQTPPGHAPLHCGEVIVGDQRDGRRHESGDGFALQARRVPTCWPMLALRPIPAVRQRVDRGRRGDCNGSRELPL